MDPGIAHYIYMFSDIESKPSTVRIVSPYHSSVKEIQVFVNDNQFLHRLSTYMDPHLADLVDIGAAVYIADRASIRHRQHQRRLMEIHLPLRHPETFENTKIYSLLQDALFDYSHDDWQFRFSHRVEQGRISELQARIDETGQFVEVALWSGGLDSFAGIFNRININSASAYTLFGTGSNLMIQGVQKRVAHHLRRVFPEQHIKLQQVPFRLVKMGQLRPNGVPRTRGFLFLLLGAVCACLEGQRKLHLYENGIGAINLPYIKSSTGLDHSRAVHPVSLISMSKLVSAVLRDPFVIHNPFLFWTKAEMCALPVKNKYSWLIDSTITCDRRHRTIHVQCGRCSSCLLRRQALAVNGLNEQSYVVLAKQQINGSLNARDGVFLRAMLQQVDTLRTCLNTNNPWQALVSEYPDLLSISWSLASIGEGEEKQIEEKLVQLYKHYVAEWDLPNVRHILGNGLLFSDEMPIVV